MKGYIFLIFFACLFSNRLSAQSNESYKQEFDSLTKKVVHNINFSRELREECKSSSISFIISFNKKGKKKDIIFSKNFPVDLKNDIINKVWVFESIKWERFFPVVKNNSYYSILIPVVYYFDVDCMEKIRSEEFANIINDGLTFDSYPLNHLFLLKPLIIRIGKPIR
ncbi:hypothetical protein CLV51_102372 [Chitinophaga niastensis]|uniref:TonB-like protein n=1 Tax=Chitinophaga niastensis TaxID=536980 RepID=A0A2P8HMS3_CHINA|nr:hypothetical protein [Chitinophaga niastensis]PSL47515.1 hypothetical protein CLV51_102372 [Chitinophaga niastensis]